MSSSPRELLTKPNHVSTDADRDVDEMGDPTAPVTLLHERMVILRAALSSFLGTGRLRDGNIAAALGISDSDWTHMKKGRRTVSPETLSDLVKYINAGLVPELFRCSIPQMIAWMKRHHVGNYGGIRDDRPLSVLLDWAKAPKPPETLTIVATRGSGRRGGLEIETEVPEDCLVLQLGDQAKITVSVRGAGHLMLLSEHVGNGEVTSLIPSPLFASTAFQAARMVTVPDPEKGSLSVTAPIGLYRLYGIWMESPPRRDFLQTASAGEKLPNGRLRLLKLTDVMMRNLVSHLHAARGSSRPPHVMVAEYRVTKYGE